MKDRNINIVNTKEKMIEPFKKIRVCAYVRVSTVNEKQQDSLKNQTEYYKGKLNKNPDYVNCGIYSDSGVSGTKTDRPGLNELMRKAREGKIDLILTKSISRFARNTVMLLNIVRELKELNVAVIFEEQNINTLSSEGELMLTVLGAFAEEERKAQSEIVKLSKRNRFKTGDHAINTKNLLGYTKNEDGKIIIDEKQAAIVRDIYKRYLMGETGGQIVKALNKLNVPTYTKNPWNTSRIIRMLANEKYCGDYLMQKFFVDEEGKEKKNRGQLPQYFIKDNHPAVISRSDWEKVQNIRRKRHKPYPLSRMLKCSYCGASLVHSKNKRWIYWECNTKKEYTKKACKGICVPEKKIIELQEKTPITEPMVVMEVENEKGSTGRSKKDYYLIPAKEHKRENQGK